MDLKRNKKRRGYSTLLAPLHSNSHSNSPSSSHSVFHSVWGRLRLAKATALMLLTWGAIPLALPFLPSDGTLFHPEYALAQNNAPAWEAYSVARPDLLRPDGTLTVSARAHPELGSDWGSLREAHLEVVAQLLELYPEEPLYFLARDSELLYDAARFLLRNDSTALRRVHLLNISRANMRADHVLDYLAQEGISPQSLRAGARPVFIDTGFSGTIPRVIAEQLPQEVRPFLRTHLICSSNSEHPSSRVFLTSINPAAAAHNPSSLHGSIISYEHLPRVTDRSTRFAQVGGRWEPMSPRGTTGTG
ncbi:MAG: hypothetical protein EBZ48_16770, partial [Proteobacteria bacterium]|nr:hypothetical protein [Pseudomonadota bacterium]